MAVSDPYLHPDSDVLINHLGITSPSKLSAAENALATSRSLQLAHSASPKTFDLDHLRWIHCALFSDLYSWAGEPRMIDIPHVPEFVAHDRIDEFARRIFLKLHHGPLFSEHKVGGATFLDESAKLLFRLNLLHPFRDGNGRTQRIFLNMVAARSGRSFDWSKISERVNLEASVRSVAQGPCPLRRILKRTLVSSRESRIRLMTGSIRTRVS